MWEIETDTETETERELVDQERQTDRDRDRHTERQIQTPRGSKWTDSREIPRSELGRPQQGEKPAARPASDFVFLPAAQRSP